MELFEHKSFKSEYTSEIYGVNNSVDYKSLLYLIQTSNSKNIPEYLMYLLKPRFILDYNCLKYLIYNNTDFKTLEQHIHCYYDLQIYTQYKYIAHNDPAFIILVFVYNDNIYNIAIWNDNRFNHINLDLFGSIIKVIGNPDVSIIQVNKILKYVCKFPESIYNLQK
jgi:hypothetical protein